MNVSRCAIVVASILAVGGCRTSPFESAADRAAEFNSNRIPDVDTAAGDNPTDDDDQRTNSWAQRNPSTGSVSDEPSSLAELIQRGNSDAAEGRYEEAKKSYRRVLQVEPNHPMAHHRLAVIADNQRDFPTAEHHYKIAVEADPNNPNLLNDLGYSYLLQARYDQSERFLHDALQVDPSLTRAAKNLGLLYGTMGDYDRALAAFRRAGSDREAEIYLSELFPQQPATGTPPIQQAAVQPGNNWHTGNNWNAGSNSASELSQQYLQAVSNEYAAGPSGASPMPGDGLTHSDSVDQPSHYSANRRQPPAAAWATESTDQQRQVVIQPGNTWPVPSSVGSSAPPYGPQTNTPLQGQPWQQNAGSPMPASRSTMTAGPQSFPAGNTGQPSNGDAPQYHRSSIPRSPLGQDYSQFDRLGPAGVHATASDMRFRTGQPVYQQEGLRPATGPLPRSPQNVYGSSQYSDKNQTQHYPAQPKIQQQSWAQGQAAGFQRQHIEPTAFSDTGLLKERPVSSPHDMGPGIEEARRTAAIMGLDVGQGSPFPVSTGPLDAARYSGNATGRLPDAAQSADAGPYRRQHEITIQSGPGYHPNLFAAVTRAGVSTGAASPWDNNTASSSAQQPGSWSTGQRPMIQPGHVAPRQSPSLSAWPQEAWNHSTPTPSRNVQSVPPNNGPWPVQQPLPATRPYSTAQTPQYGAPPAGWSAQQPVSTSTNVPIWPSAPRQN